MPFPMEERGEKQEREREREREEGESGEGERVDFGVVGICKRGGAWG